MLPVYMIIMLLLWVIILNPDTVHEKLSLLPWQIRYQIIVCQPHLTLKIENLAPLKISSFISGILLVCVNHRALKFNVSFLFLRNCWQTAFNKGYAAPQLMFRLHW